MFSISSSSLRLHPLPLRQPLPHRPPPPLSGLCFIGRESWTSNSISSNSRRFHAVPQTSFQEYSVDLVHDKLPVFEWLGNILEESTTKENIKQLIDEVRKMMASMEDGEISISAYDTAWVALVHDISGNDGPQFPSSLKWIVDNQLHDGSWGDDCIFSASDRMINTLACVTALRSWNICPESCERGMSFLRENMWRLAEEHDEHMPIGFEIAFPSLVDIAKELRLELPYHDPALRHIYAMRNLKLKKIPTEVMHRVPTTLLHSLEGMPGLDWSRLLRMQSSDGSFLSSPSSTAYALMQTRDEKCLAYLQKAVDKFNGGVPNVYPVDLFEHIWAVDRLERLGISRYFEPEIKACVDYVHRYWSKDGICWARNSPVHDVDDTAMAFRLLRLHGYDVSPDVFLNFEKEEEFFCFAGQSNQAVTGIYNLNRAAQVAFADEEILNRAKVFSDKFLREKQASGQLLDKWIITKDLPGEVGYALDFPWYASLPRVETRLYVEQYGGAKDVWIGKTLYRMPNVNNEVYLELAKADYNKCQALHQIEWLGLQRWHEECEMAKDNVSRDALLRAYFLATASIFEPERAQERLGWSQTIVLAEIVSSFFYSASSPASAREVLLHKLPNGPNGHSRLGKKTIKDDGAKLAEAVRQLVNRIASDAQPAPHAGYQSLQYQQHMRHHLTSAWEEWIRSWRGEGEEEEDETVHLWRRWPEGRDEMALLIVRTLEACSGRSASGPVGCDDEQFERLASRTSSICHRLRRAAMLVSQVLLVGLIICRKFIFSQDETETSNRITSDKALEAEMQELVQCVLQGSGNLDDKTRQTFLTVTKSFYYAAHCPPATLNSHIAKVLFQLVV